MGTDRKRTVVACVAGAALALLAASRTWVQITQVRPAPLPPLHEAKTGTALLPWLPALGLVALAGAGVLLATRGLLRAAVGVVLLLCGAGLVAGALSRFAVGWPLVTALGGLLVAGSGASTLVRGRAWPGMAARYDRPTRDDRPTRAGGPPTSGSEIWDALDRGNDPTR